MKSAGCFVGGYETFELCFLPFKKPFKLKSLKGFHYLKDY